MSAHSASATIRLFSLVVLTEHMGCTLNIKTGQARGLEVECAATMRPRLIPGNKIIPAGTALRGP